MNDKTKNQQDSKHLLVENSSGPTSQKISAPTTGTKQQNRPAPPPKKG
jgi:hypothetical protein